MARHHSTYPHGLSFEWTLDFSSLSDLSNISFLVFIKLSLVQIPFFINQPQKKTSSPIMVGHQEILSEERKRIENAAVSVTINDLS
jgi:hypothetical protein